MQSAASWKSSRWARVSALVLSIVFVTVTMGGSCPGGVPNPGPTRHLFVVSNTQGVTSYTSADTANGDVLPTTRLIAGANTNIFQPRSIVVTKDNRLLVSRQNGGLTVHDNAKTVTGDVLANRTVEGNQSLLTSPISFAYDKINDRLFVGNVSTNDGILVFDSIANPIFTGDRIPSRKFNPPDRAPTFVTPMTINALELDAGGGLYVADTSGLNVNSSRILFFETPGTANGNTQVGRTLTSLSWAVIEDMAIAGNSLYVVDGSANIYVFTNLSAANNLIAPARTITITGNGVAIRGIAISSTGQGFVADSGNHAIHKINNITGDTTLGSMVGSTIITGANTALSTPRQMYLIEQ